MKKHNTPFKSPTAPLAKAPQLAPHDGRSDTIKTTLPAGAFVMPADVVSNLGRGSSAAGHQVMAGLGGMPAQNVHPGAVQGQGPQFPVHLSQDESVVPPAQVAALGGNHLALGGQFLQNMLTDHRLPDAVSKPGAMSDVPKPPRRSPFMSSTRMK